MSGRRLSTALVLKSMANKKKTAKAADEGFLTTAAQAIGSTLGQLALKTGVVATPPAGRKKAAVKKIAAVKRKTVIKKKAVSEKKAQPKRK
jgi:hypothetical protein